MAKCVKCGGSFLTRGRVKLMDADICFKCFDSLGFDHKTELAVARTMYRWDDIKDGRSAYWRNKKRKHEEWMEEHPEVSDFMDALEESTEDETESEDNEEE